MKIQVTQNHISKGKKYSYSNCPIALALKEILPKSYNISISAKYLLLKTPEKKAIHLPYSAIFFIRNFDGGFFVEPLEFELPITIVDNKIEVSNVENS